LDTALHTFTFANAIEAGLRPIHRPAARRVRRSDERLLDRFLNIPAARLPKPVATAPSLRLYGESYLIC
jgi:hypothetical protein